MKKRIVSMVLAAVMISSMALPISAMAEEETATEAAEVSGDDVSVTDQDASDESNDTAKRSDEAVDAILNATTNAAFSTEPVTDEDLEIILQAGANAPSGMNLQTWHFTVVTEDLDLMSELARYAVEGNVVIVVSGEEGTVGNEYIDCSLATESMYLAAQALGYGARIYTSTATGMSDEMKTALEIPDGYTPITVLQIGHYEDYADTVSSASTRNSLDDIVNYIGD